MRMPAVPADILTNTDSGTPSPVSARRARLDVPAVASSGRSVDTRPPMIADRLSGSQVFDAAREPSPVGQSRIDGQPSHTAADMGTEAQYRTHRVTIPARRPT